MVGIDQELSPFPTGSTDTPMVVCLDLEAMWQDLDALFAKVESDLARDGSLAARFDLLVRENRETFTEGNKISASDTAAWRGFLSSRRWEI